MASTTMTLTTNHTKPTMALNNAKATITVMAPPPMIRTPSKKLSPDRPFCSMLFWAISAG